MIYDVGLFNGDDTAYYLWRGFRVVAVEANPYYVAQNKQRFATEIKNGRLIIEPVGIADKEGEGVFWINDVHDDWNSFNRHVTSNGGNPIYEPHCHSMTVPVMPLSKIFEQHGVPYYLKSDIEGHDRFCLASLTAADLPVYLSVEAHDTNYLTRMYELGYRHFKLINQARGHVPSNYWYFRPATSGPFGEETIGEWHDYDYVVEEWERIKRGEMVSDIPQEALTWADWHAKK